jgi:acyl-CoA synthetase (AMP-forming)/AMP-acid ligase II
VLQLTSGSTGEPRVARHPLTSIVRGADLYRQIHGYRETDRILLPIPLAHSFGMIGGLVAGLTAGARVLTVPRFTLTAVRSGLERGATVLLGTPLLYSMLSRSLGDALGAHALRLLLSSGGPLASDVAEAVEGQAGIPVTQVYGSTETGLIACRSGRDRAWSAGSVGAFAPGVEWRLVPEQDTGGAGGAGADDVDSGRLQVRTSTMFTGYADAGAAPAGVDGFYDTGDVAEVSASGEVFLLGRKSTFVNVGGRKVNPRRLERIIGGLPGIADVHVLGFEHGPGPGREEAVHAMVVPEPGHPAPLRPADVVRLCRDRLAGYEVPHRVHIVPELPRTALGKVDHRAARAVVAAAASEQEPATRTF